MPQCFVMNGDKQNTVICVLCKTELQRGEDKSTSQMKNHLQVKHKISTLKVSEWTLQSPSCRLPGLATNCSLRARICYYRMPPNGWNHCHLRLVSSRCFHAFKRKSLKWVCWRHWRRIWDRFDLEQHQVYACILEEDLRPFRDASNNVIAKIVKPLWSNQVHYNEDASRIMWHDASLSFDFWTDPNTSHSFGTLNLSIASFTKQTHSSSMEAQIRIVCLGAIRCKEAHTGPNIAVWTHNILQEYGCFSTNLCGIPRVLLSVATTDNGSNVINAVTQLQLLHMPCFAHTLSLCVFKKPSMISRAWWNPTKDSTPYHAFYHLANYWTNQRPTINSRSFEKLVDKHATEIKKGLTVLKPGR